MAPFGGKSASGAAVAYERTATPFGISRASAPRCSTIVRRAASDTAIRARNFSKDGCINGRKVLSIRERGFAV